jgi:hypothetical protein
MPKFQHTWEMTDIQFGFIIFEKCVRSNNLRTYFSKNNPPSIGDEYREDNHTWRCMESVQSFRFNLRCKKCGRLEKFYDLMGFLYCTGCLPDCEVEIQQKKLEPQKKWVMLAFGHLPKKQALSFSQKRLDILQNYFNQRRDTSRSTIVILSYDLIENFSRCKGEFIHDVGMLSNESPPAERKSFLKL